MSRKIIDCRATPNEVGCTLTIAGEPNEVVDAAAAHAVAVHGHSDGPELRALLREALTDENAKVSSPA
jgi:plasmid stability protein